MNIFYFVISYLYVSCHSWPKTNFLFLRIIHLCKQSIIQCCWYIFFSLFQMFADLWLGATIFSGREVNNCMFSSLNTGNLIQSQRWFFNDIKMGTSHLSGIFASVEHIMFNRGVPSIYKVASSVIMRFSTWQSFTMRNQHRTNYE